MSASRVHLSPGPSDFPKTSTHSEELVHGQLLHRRPYGMMNRISIRNKLGVTGDGSGLSSGTLVLGCSSLLYTFNSMFTQVVADSPYSVLTSSENICLRLHKLHSSA